MHSISSYVGRIKPAFAHFLIKELTTEGQVVLDPFCGIGTIPLELDQLNRKFIGNDLNPYAVLISKSKFDRRGVDEEINFLNQINLKKEPIPDLESVPIWVKEYFHQKTLVEILQLKEILIKNERNFLYGCLLGILHGHRPQHLSIRTGYIIPYIPNPKPKKEYREVIPRMISKASRMYKDEVSLDVQGKILQEDSRKLSLKTNSVNNVISSPPYYHTLDYVHSNRLRLWLCDQNDHQQEELTTNLIQQRSTYLDQMHLVGREMKRVLKKDGLLVFILGDVHLSPNKSLNTAEDIADLYEKIGFKKVDIINDQIPASKTTIVKYGGTNSIQKKKEKLDRVLIMRNV
ncbi:site-specific DNA-methyltransferase [Gammaproteobacteria bacterium]|nr:site-specific DNA-methyltransferase [Gammaproteobacteria bacterium]